ncbi:hypothetical protein C922_04493 [Plasmodium inui San Antonio 1]|uniref:Uncharacterized protein n=1 Tax=Plasmodium inui San Antonio 1 TaxID=1237626 RepID=W7A1A4_9APIC|nr:hypothetical protein C922_04493 [Plasmodium inui San Antonio 1]EUD65093.1 hypothetical protein C922_04493 [Plasmodium inui San Antonio 1]
MIFKQIAEKASKVLMGSNVVKESDLKVKAQVGKETEAGKDTETMFHRQCNEGDTAGRNTPVNHQRDKLSTTMNDKKRMHERAKKKVNLFLKRYKLEGRKKKKKKKNSSKSSLLVLSQKKNNRLKNLKKMNKLRKIKEDYLTILKVQNEFTHKYQEEKSFRESIRSYHSNELAKDYSYALFFFRLFVRGEYLNGETLTEALVKDNRRDADAADHVLLPPIDESNQDKHSQITRKSLKNAVAFLNGRNTRLLMCDYLKILMNNIQNENEISANFLMLEYVSSQGTKQQNNYTQMCNTYKLKGHGKEEQSILSYSFNSVKEKGVNSVPSGGGPILENSEKDHIGNNSHENNVQKDRSSVNNSMDLTISGDRSGAAISLSVDATRKGNDPKEVENPSKKKENADFVQMNELLFNKILNNFVTELKSFFLSVIAKMQTSHVVSELITHFAEICLTLTPYYVHIVNCIEILSDFANIIPVRHMDHLMSFFRRNKNIFIEKYKEFQNFVIFNDPIKTQSVGARLIGFIKILQKKNSLNTKQKSMNVFFLHLLLSECLPINHLGFCNRQSVKNNFHLFFYDSLQRCKDTANDESLIFSEFELGIRQNVKNHAKIRELILAEINSLCLQGSTSDGTLSSAIPNGDRSCGGDAKPDEDHSDQANHADDADHVSRPDRADRQDDPTKGDKPKEDLLSNRDHCGLEEPIHPPSKDKKAHTNGRDSIRKRKRDEEETPDQVIHSDKKDIKRPKRNLMAQIPNEEKKNYKAYLAYLYLISFVRSPEMCTSQNCAPLEDAYNSFNLFLAHIKNVKKKNLTSVKIVKEYLYNSDIDFLGNIHIYNLLIRDKNFICVFFFNLLLVLNYLNVELNILTPTANEDSSSEYRTVDSKGKETNRSTTSALNLDTANQSASAQSLEGIRNSEDKSGNSPFWRNSSRTYSKNAKEGTSQMGSNTSSLIGRGKDNDPAHPGISGSSSRGTQNIPKEVKEVKDVKDVRDMKDINAGDTKGKDHQSVSERTKHTLHLFVKDLLRHLSNSKSMQFFMNLLASEYCWYSWKKQLTGKPTKENSESPFEFNHLEDQSKRNKKHKKQKTNHTDNGMVDENSSPVQTLIQLVHNFELLNEKMKNYYLANLDNPNLRKNPYNYTKLIGSCEGGSNRQMQTNSTYQDEREASHFPAPTNKEDCSNGEEVEQRGHSAKQAIDEIGDGLPDQPNDQLADEPNDELPDQPNDLKAYPQSLRDIRKVNNFLLEINKIYLGRQAEFWELDDSDSLIDLRKKKNEEKILIEKLIDKLEDYKQKMHIDNDPVNEIEESEKSKNDPVFKFRLAKLFIVKYIDLYTIVKDKEFSTDCDFLYNLMVHMDKNLAKKKILLSAQEGEVGEEVKTDGETVDVREEAQEEAKANGKEKAEGEEVTVGEPERKA